MDLDLDAATLEFQAEVRSWLAAHVRPLSSMDTAQGFEEHRSWERLLASERLSVVSWPSSYGGREASLLQWLVFEEEYHASGAPGRVSQNGIFLLAPTLFAHGTDEQRARILPSMARGDEVWAQAWSEPEAGSDLASLRSTAVRCDGGWLLRGQKTWSSRAAFADRAFGLFRTGTGERHRGLTYLLFDLRSEGVTVRPIAQLDGEPGFAEVFLDDVFVPDRDVVGEVGDGWRVAMSTAGNERGLTLRSPGRFTAAASRLVELYRKNPDPALRDRVVDAWIGAQAYRLHTFGALAHPPSGPAASVTKVFWSELDVALHETALDLLGEVAPGWRDGWLFSLSGPIYAGTNEIQRNVIAERILGLPR
ncbi:acyl-CoA dehydrogenase family protein [Lentzea sp. NPDC051208]|uniref:acyl-CoA dehydrogenase family protein n=1 Tax=Lentzea sp. NPDC051208 TaxID=3154642 RepID=UPI00343BFA7A